MPILYNAITGAKSPNGTWTKIGGPTDPVAPVTYDADVDFSSAEKGTHIYQYETESGTVLGCTDTSTVTVEVGESFPMVNDECTSAINIAVPFGNSLPLPTINYSLTNQWLSCESGVSILPGYCSLEPATLTSDYTWTVTNADCDSWYRVTLPNYMTTDYTITVTVSSAAYPTNPLLSPKIELFTSGNPVDCTEGLDFLTSSTAGAGYTVTADAFLSGTSASFLWIRVGAKNFEGGNFNITINT